MGQYSGMLLTNDGKNLQAQAQSGLALIITKVALGDGLPVQGENYETFTALKNQIKTFNIQDIQVTGDGQSRVRCVITNDALSTGFFVREIGIFAKIGQSGTEKLYSYTNAGTQADFLPAKGVNIVEQTLDTYIVIGNATNVTAVIDDRVVIATKEDVALVDAKVSDLKGFVGYTDTDIYGVEVDFQNKTFKRLAGAVGKAAGADFDGIKAFGGRRRCIVTNNGAVLAYHGDVGYTETGLTTELITVGGTNYPSGTAVQVMVEQPKVYYKVVPLKIEPITGGIGWHMRKARYYVSDTPKPGFKVHPAFFVNNVEKSKIYPAAFEGCIFDVSVAAAEVDTLTVTAGATADGTLTITLDGIAFTVPILASDNTTELVATKIKGTVFSGWAVGGEGSAVTFTCNQSGVKSLLTFAAGTSGVTATVAQTVTGAGGYVKNDAQIGDFATTTGDILCSIANAKPASGKTQDLTRAKTRIIANNRGSGWQQSSAVVSSLTQLLFAIEYATLNSQTAIGSGVSNVPDVPNTANNSVMTGATSSLGNASGMAAGTNGLVSISYRGEENFWGNIWSWQDGLNIEANSINQAYWADNGFVDGTKTSPYQNCGFTLAKANGYVSAIGYSEKCDFMFLASEVLGASNLPVGDYFYQNNVASGFLVAALGGDWNNGLDDGAFSWLVTYAASYRHGNVGGRLLYVPAA